ncbi:hypothetical protein ACH4U6_37040, partial [Streptomyces netropsis]
MGVEPVVRVFCFPLDVGPAGVEVLERHAGAARWAFNFAHAVMLGQWQAFDARKQAAAEARAGLSRDEILARLGKSERRALYAEAKKRLRAENTAWCADLAVWDEHRRRVVHKGKPVLDPGPVPGEDASDLARRLYARRRLLAALQGSDPVGYAAEKKAELARVRPRVLELKEQLAARGAYRPGAYDVQAMWMTRRDLPREEGGSPWWPEVARGVFLCGFDRADTAWKNWMASAAGTRKGARMGMPRFKKKGRATDSFTLANP